MRPILLCKVLSLSFLLNLAIIVSALRNSKILVPNWSFSMTTPNFLKTIASLLFLVVLAVLFMTGGEKTITSDTSSLLFFALVASALLFLYDSRLEAIHNLKSCQMAYEAAVRAARAVEAIPIS